MWDLRCIMRDLSLQCRESLVAACRFSGSGPCGIYPWPGIKPHPLNCKRDLITGPPRKYLYLVLISISWPKPKHTGSLDIDTDTVLHGGWCPEDAQQHLQKEVWMHEVDSLSVIHGERRREHQGFPSDQSLVAQPFSNIFPQGCPDFCWNISGCRNHCLLRAIARQKVFPPLWR